MSEVLEGSVAEPLHGEILYSEAEVDERIGQMASEIIGRYKDENPLFVCLMRGAVPFASKLIFEIVRQDRDFNPEVDNMTVTTYGAERQAHPPQVIYDLAPDTETQGRRVVLLDDCLDKGITADFTSEYLKSQHGAAEVDLVVLVQKQRPRQHFAQATLYGFEARDVWLTGMGLDDAHYGKEAGRWLSYIAIAGGVEEG
jgi:hypoxanthine phosphoribosyltransferase